MLMENSHFAFFLQQKTKGSLLLAYKAGHRLHQSIVP
jgi:hypothetical protein